MTSITGRSLLSSAAGLFVAFSLPRTAGATAKVGQEFDAPYSLTETGRATLAEMAPRHAA